MSLKNNTAVCITALSFGVCVMTNTAEASSLAVSAGIETSQHEIPEVSEAQISAPIAVAFAENLDSSNDFGHTSMSPVNWTQTPDMDTAAASASEKGDEKQPLNTKNATNSDKSVDPVESMEQTKADEQAREAAAREAAAKAAYRAARDAKLHTGLKIFEGVVTVSLAIVISSVALFLYSIC